jgi:ABC-2 type transport system ATP-binding protein
MFKINKIQFAFGAKVIFTDISMDFRQGEVTGIVGKNGVGKTTLFRLMAGIYKLQGGNILLNGQKIKPSDITLMPTEPYFYPFMKGSEYLKIVANNKSENEMSEHYASALEVPLDELIDNYSTGMRKKLAFAALFSISRPIIILDEPYNGVDLESNELIKHIIHNHHNNRVVILSSHILSTLTDISDCIYHLKEDSHISLFHKKEYEILDIALKKSMEEKINKI